MLWRTAIMSEAFTFDPRITSMTQLPNPEWQPSNS